ncbi:MAG: glycosyltransferase family 4 protein [Deltaproteobacteria bacterium]|nr:MAG: glycosyltransferase family 4 protein [Deltaproteobacteria bacterium]
MHATEPGPRARPARLRILYVSLSYVPSRRASSMQVMNMCAALAARGHEVTLIAKRPAVSDADAPATAGATDHAFYGVAPAFRIDKLARPAWRGGGVVYAASMAGRLVAARGRVDLVYSRDLAGTAIAAALGLPFVFELHGVPAGGWQRVLRRFAAAPACRGLVAISEALRRDLDAAGLLRVPVVVAHDACDAALGRPPRGELGAPPRIGYVGNLYRGRGVELVLALAGRMPRCRFELVGGSEADLARIRGDGVPANVVLHGFVPPARLAEFYAGFDVLLLPHPRSGVRGATGGADISRWTSPMKMFEYMASGAPIVASDLPVLGEVLGDGVNALIAPAGDAAAWQQAIERLLGDAALRVRLATRAQADLRRDHTWAARAERVLRGLGLEP